MISADGVRLSLIIQLAALVWKINSACDSSYLATTVGRAYVETSSVRIRPDIYSLQVSVVALTSHLCGYSIRQVTNHTARLIVYYDLISTAARHSKSVSQGLGKDWDYRWKHDHMQGDQRQSKAGNK